MTEHPNAARFRGAFTALWERGDPTVMDALLAEDIIWINDIGAGPWRELRGKASVDDMFNEWFVLFDGGFRHELIDICASDRHVVAILREIGTAHGHTFDNLALYKFEVGDDGRYQSARTYDQDRDAIEQFWQAIGPVTAAPVPGD